VSHCFAELLPRIFNREKDQDKQSYSSLILDILIYRSPVFLIIYELQTSKNGPFFLYICICHCMFAIQLEVVLNGQKL